MCKRAVVSKSVLEFATKLMGTRRPAPPPGTPEHTPLSGASRLELAIRLLVEVLIGLAATDSINGPVEAAHIHAALDKFDEEVFPGERNEIDRLLKLIDPTGQARSGGGGVSESKSAPATLEPEMEAKAEVMSCVDASGQRLSDELVHRAVLANVAESGCMPAPGQIAWVDGRTPPRDVTSFVLRAAAFSELRFAIVGVNKLTVPAREELMRAVLSPQGRRAQLLLVLTDGERCCCLLPLFRVL